MYKHVGRRSTWVGVIAAAVVFIFVLAFPFTNPLLIHLKTKIINPRFVYYPLADDDARWEVVLAGVRSGKLIWLQVAVDLRPALDTHPGEEMFNAVSSVLGANPAGAISMLLPVYGGDIVCGQDDERVPLTAEMASNRLRMLLESSTEWKNTRDFSDCIQAAKKLLDQTRPSKKEPTDK